MRLGQWESRTPGEPLPLELLTRRGDHLWVVSPGSGLVRDVDASLRSVLSLVPQTSGESDQSPAHDEHELDRVHPEDHRGAGADDRLWCEVHGKSRINGKLKRAKKPRGAGQQRAEGEHA